MATEPTTDESNAVSADLSSQDAWTQWKARIHASRRRRDDLVAEWQENVTRRRGSPDETSQWSTGGRVTVNQDWPLTKAKVAQLYSQTPEVRLSPRAEKYRAAVPVFATQVNDTINDVGVGQTIEEVLADVVNASGIGGVMMAYEARTEPRQVPSVDPSAMPPEMQQAIATGAMQIPMTTVDHVVDCQYLAERISPADLLIPSDFTGSNYDKARWLGHDGRMTWTQAQRELGLTDDQKDKVLGADKRGSGSTHSLNTDTQKFKDGDVVNFTQLFYWRFYYHAEETSFHALQRLVFVDGLEEPVIDKEYEGQKRLEDGRLVGVLKNPIRVLTLTYISDDGLPPSDSTVSKPQVDELGESRDAMVQQRRHSIPIRWYDTNRIGPNTKKLLDKGTPQGFIPTNGDGTRAVGEVARANFPQERFEFDRIIKTDLSELWQVGTNQAGQFSSGDRTASEARIVERNFQTRVGQERDKVTRFFVGIAECLAGLIALYGIFDLPGEEDQQRIDTVSREELAQGYTYSVRVDSTVLLDADQRIEQLTRALNLTAQSGFVNPKPAISEIWELSGVDPAKVIIDPQPKPPEPVSISINSAEDIINPVMLATLMRTHQAPAPQDLQAAMQLLQQIGMAAMLGVPPPKAPASGPNPNQPPREPDTPGISNPGWEAAPRLDRRQADGGVPA